MPKKYIVRLTQEECAHLHETIKKLSGSSQKVRRAHILLKADANGPCWTDSRIAEAFNCRTKTVENIRQNFVLHGFQQALDGKKRVTPPTPKLLNGEQEARIIATRPGYANWSLRLLARHVVELEIVPSISHESVRQVIKKTG
ncbi:MAG: helix-turn-helix domain-containing protein [Candidatus Electrothrix sp. Rat3]|nr:helix-turn-helix domain-containing protein [Candidatus Electrothrix rattekaaiensis]